MKHAYTQTRTITPTVDNGNAYADGDFIGTAEEQLTDVVNEGQGIVLQSVVVLDKAKQDAALTLWFFDTEPSNTTFSNNGALTIHDTDLNACVGTVSIAATDYADASASSVATVKNVGLSMTLLSDDLWVVVMSSGAPTYATGELSIRLTYWQD